MGEAEATATTMRGAGWGRWLKIALVSLVGVILSLEVGLRVAELISPGVLGKLRPDLGATLEAARTEGHPYLALAPKPGYRSPQEAPHQISHNEWGFRGPSLPLEKAPDTYRIVCLGGSSTYGHGPSSDANTWPAKLQHYLQGQKELHGKDVQVLNGGLSGWSTFESAINLAFRMVEWQPDLVIVYHTINDMRCAMYVRHEALMDNRHWRETWPRVLEAPGEGLLEHSMTYLVLRKIFTSYVDDVDALNTYMIVDGYQDGTDWYDRQEVLDRGFDNFERNLRTIHAIAREHGARVIFASQANDERDFPEGGSGPGQLAAMERMTGILRQVAADKGDQGAVFVDAKTELKAKAVELGLDEVFTKEVHLTDTGANHLALIMAKAILLGGHGLLDG